MARRIDGVELDASDPTPKHSDAGGWLWWQSLREGKPWWYALCGSLLLCLYGVVPTFQPETKGTEDFGRVYAACGC